jgi:hypothetical protein
VEEENGMTEKMVVSNSMDTSLKPPNGASDFGNKFGQPLVGSV